MLPEPRTIGDLVTKQTGAVICDPQVSQIERKATDELLIIGSKGLWNDQDSSETAKEIRKLKAKSV